MIVSPPPPRDAFADVLEESRRFLLAIANAELPAGLRAKGGASDLVQQTLAAAHQARHQFRGHTLADLRAWLRAILAHELAGFRRAFAGTAARDVRREVPLAAAYAVSISDPVPAEVGRRETRANLAACVDRLSPPARLAVVLRIEHGLSFAQIGGRLGRSEEAARKVYDRAIADLRGRTPPDA